ncbi:LAME_0B06524g1_1 [Lachancea meyersii CBS 8951]|uniref:Coatomer subunit alpha n=1 Tax=Lachancea meyersii CBS 8951 TaxID=1266667 RepID=A0A1G4IW63_9SACH|nr:LAME_0B06524g1_1 [Lachancea meyersii CBS 8951]
MKMLTKFESKSTRAKGLAFHPSRPWVLVALFSSSIQLWDYRMGTLLHKFEDHEGPVRGIDFHPTQPLFVSAGDDYTIKVWSLDTKKCLFTLNGHLDYVRTVFFHRELPWIISASDDNTIRIWNWQNRKEIACLAGHSHFVMCADFHPKEDLVVSASLDETVRVWDISGLRKRHSAPSSYSLEEQMVAQQNLLEGGFGDCVVKFILEGHTRGVNWASFHPTLPLIVSGGDDRQVKLWRMSSTKAWEVDTCRGHTNNVDSVIFHPHQNLIISVGEDKTIRVWDLDKRTPVKQFKREHDRFWLARAHPNINLFGAAHDSGIMVFKLDRERPCSVIYQNQLIFVNKEKQVQTFDYHKKIVSLPYASLKKIGHTWNAFRSISYSPSQHSVLVNCSDNQSEKFALCVLPKQPTGAVEPTSIIEDTGSFPTFVARNRFVVYNSSSSVLEVRGLDNKITKTIKIENDSTVKDVVYGGPGSVLVLKSKSVVLFDVQQARKVAEVALKNVKYVSWSLDSQYIALMSKHTITIVTKNLEVITSMHETIRIKSAAWDESGVLIYSTLNHIKYTLLNGDNGIIKTLENTLYINKVHGKFVYALNREGEVEILTIDPTEYCFKKALVNRNFPEVLRIIQNSNLVGQNIISYLQKSGFPDIALQFVQEPQTRFDLALEHGDLSVAHEEAQKLDNSAAWEQLGQAALQQGNIELAEAVYQNQKQFDKLSFLYLISGDLTKLAKMESIAEQRGDISSVILNTIYNKSNEKRGEIFAQGGSLPLAYAIAKANNQDSNAAKILEAAGVSENDVTLPEGISFATHYKSPLVPEPVKEWPLEKPEPSFFEKALAGGMEKLDIQEEAEDDIQSPSNTFEAQQTAFSDEEFVAEDDGGWDMGEEDLGLEVDVPETEVEEQQVTKAPADENEMTQWTKNSKLPYVLIAAGAFEAAAQALNKQAGLINFEPLRPRFHEIYESCRTYMSATPTELPSITGLIRANTELNAPESLLPFVAGSDVVTNKMNKGFRLFKANKLELAIEVFRDVIYTITLLAVDNQEDETLALKAMAKAREYILGISIELARRSLPADDVKRNLELASYFTTAKLLPPHRSTALQVAMSQSFKHKNFIQASYFAGEFLKIVTTGPRSEQAQKVKDRAELMASDAIEVDFDPYAEFVICASTFTPIYNDTPAVTDPLTGAKYHSSEKGKLDVIASVSKIGTPASGLRILLA